MHQRLSTIAVALAVAGGLALLWGLGAYFGHDPDEPRGLGNYLPLFLAGGLLAAAADRLLALAAGSAQSRVVDAHWARIMPADSTVDRAARRAASAGAYGLFALPASLSYLLSGGADRDAIGVILALAALAAGVWLAGRASYSALLLLRVRDAKVLISPRVPVPGDTLRIRISQKYRKAVHVERARIGVLCLTGGGDAPTTDSAPRPGRGSLGRPAPVAGLAVFESWKEAAVRRDADEQNRLRVEHAVRLPDDAALSSPDVGADGGGSRRWVRWHIALVISMSEGPPYEAHFPFVVHARLRDLTGAEDEGAAPARTTARSERGG